MTRERIDLHVSGSVAVITLDDPGVLNALSTPMLRGLGDALGEIEDSLLGEEISAERALEWGLCNRVFDDDQLGAQAHKLAERLAAGPTVALGLIRKAYWESPGNTYPDQLRLERELQRAAGQTRDFIEGVTAFQQKRAARFQGA